MEKKAIGLLSGGLDSYITVKMMIDLGIKVVALNYKSPFCTCTAKSSGCSNEALRIAKEFDIPIRTFFLGQEYIEMVANPKYGYGKNMNPCIDCRIMMCKKAKEVMKEEGASFVFTGEVLGQRPMSQRRDTMRVIERDSGLDGLILRPLSAKLFEPTIPETEGVVDRDKLLDLSGRSRKPQISLTETLGIKGYQCPAGGCLLTDSFFAGRMRDILKNGNIPTIKEVKLLRVGRHFRLNRDNKFIVGRDEKENNLIENLAEKEDTLVKVSEYTGPTGIVTGYINEKGINIAAGITIRYSDAPDNIDIQVDLQQKEKELTKKIYSKAVGEESLAEMRI